MSESTFIDLPMDIESITEPKAGPEGSYTLVITDIKERTNESGQLKGLLAIHEVANGPVGVGPEDVANVLHNISLPLPEDDQEKVKNKLLFLKRYLAVFGIPMNGSRLDIPAFIGKRATVQLTLDEYQGVISNKIKLPNLR